MTLRGTVVRLGTRASALALWQTEYVRAELARLWPAMSFEARIISTTGDRVLDTPLPLIGGKGLFTAELEEALHNGSIDLAVHSLKDLPTEMPLGLVLGAVPERADPSDAFVSREGVPLAALPMGSCIGTSSTRRAAQLLHYRPDLRLRDLRGNADTRLRKALDPAGPYDAIVMARAALERLGRLDAASEVPSSELMLPAPGQGAMAVQCRAEKAVLDLIRPLNHTYTELAVTGERAFLEGLGGGCAVPVAALGKVDDRGVLALRGRVSSPDGLRRVDVALDSVVLTTSGPSVGAARSAGLELAALALEQGARGLLEAES